MAAVTTVAVTAVSAAASYYSAQKAAGQQKATAASMAALQEPYTTAGGKAADALGDMVGDYTQSPLYKYQMKQGLSSVQKSYAARGMGNSPAAIEAEGTMAEKIGASESDKMYERTYKTASMGSSQATSTGAQQIGSTATSSNTEQAGTMAAAGAISGGMQAYNQQTSYDNWLSEYRKKNQTIATPETIKI